MLDWGAWEWGEIALRTGGSSDEVKSLPHHGQLAELLYDIRDGRLRKPKLPPQAVDDLKERIAYTVRTLSLPESVDQILKQFLDMDFIGAWIKTRREEKSRRRSK
jgi:hypothetical protein